MSLGTDYEYCWRADELEDGSIGAPAGILIAGAHDAHIASGSGVTQHLLDSTDVHDASRIYVEHNGRCGSGELPQRRSVQRGAAARRPIRHGCSCGARRGGRRGRAVA